MSILYLTEQGTSLHVSGKRYILLKQKDKKLDIPDFYIERIFLVGNIQLTTQAIKHILSHGIPCTILSVHGKYYGSLQGYASGNVFLRICQYERYLDNDFRLALTKQFVRGKIRNHISQMKAFAYKNEQKYHSIENCVDKLETLYASIQTCKDQNRLLGIEGSSSKYYFSSFRLMVYPPYIFINRNRRPPKDPVNALLSLTYTMINSEILSFLYGSGFDPYIGFLHGLSYNRPSLSLDVIEEFRATMNFFVLLLMQRSKLTISMFEKNKESVLLNEEGRNLYFLEYEKFLKEYKIRDIIKKQVFKLSESIQKRIPYDPYVFT